MRRNYTAAIKSAVNGIYDGSLDGAQHALWEILEALDHNMAELMHEDEEAAVTKVNKEDDEDEDGPDESSLIDDEMED